MGTPPYFYSAAIGSYCITSHCARLVCAVARLRSCRLRSGSPFLAV